MTKETKNDQVRRDGDQERRDDRRIGASLGSSVRATHLFLSESEIDRIKGYVPQALRQVQHLLVDSAGKVNGISGSVRKTCVKITFSARMQVEKL